MMCFVETEHPYASMRDINRYVKKYATNYIGIGLELESELFIIEKNHHSLLFGT